MANWGDYVPRVNGETPAETRFRQDGYRYHARLYMLGTMADGACPVLGQPPAEIMIGLELLAREGDPILARWRRDKTKPAGR